MLEFELTGPRGDNPLGFLAALGALVTLEDAGWRPHLAWKGLTPRLWVEPHPALDPNAIRDNDRRNLLLAVLEAKLRREPTEGGSAADPSVSLGKDLSVSGADFLAHTDSAVEHASASDRRWADLVAAYGVADPSARQARMAATPWALVSGSGHQYFLGSVAQLMTKCDVTHLERALFGPWIAQDAKYSLRLDIAEDRRHALMDRDPTATDNKPRTLWGANRLAFEALQLFPAMPARGGMAVRAWRAPGGDWRGGCAVRWPLWTPPAGAAVVGSLLGLPALWHDGLEARAWLQGLGVYAVYESRRIAVGEGGNVKFNLTPPVAIWRC